MSKINSRNAYRKNSLELYKDKCPLKKVQLDIKINISFKLTEFIPTYSHSKSITFRLKPPSSSKEIEHKTPPPLPSAPAPASTASEVYSNPKLIEKIKEFQPKLHVNLSELNLIDDDMKIITDQVLEERKCTELWLYGNQFTWKSLIILSLNLKTNSLLTSLDLSDNQISDQGVRLLSEGILFNSNNSLQYLYLSQNSITDYGIKYLSDMLEKNTKLTDLWLSNNEITNQGIKQLFDILNEKNQTLKFLSISMNKLINDLSIDSIIQLNQYNQILKNIWIKDCNFTEEGKLKLQEIFHRKNKLKIDL